LIQTLTKEQKEKFKDYVNKYTKIGLSTETIDKDKATKFCFWLYKFLGKENKPKIIFTKGPLDSFLTALLLNILDKNQVRNQVENQVRNQVWVQVWDQVWVQVKNQVGNQVGNQVRNQVENQMGKQMKNSNNLSFVWPYLDGQFWSPFISFFNFISEELKIELIPDYYKFKEIINYGLIYPLEEYCIVSERLETIYKNERGLHNENGPCLTYRDGFSLWALNGVTLNKEIVETPSENLDPNIVFKETNVERRREIIRKIGIERIIKLGQIIDKDGDYELIDLNLNSETSRPYLKMINPSTKDIHVEGVHPSCRTIKDAIQFRNSFIFSKSENDEKFELVTLT